jgi:hypothetical protein
MLSKLFQKSYNWLREKSCFNIFFKLIFKRKATAEIFSAYCVKTKQFGYAKKTITYNGFAYLLTKLHFFTKKSKN